MEVINNCPSCNSKLHWSNTNIDLFCNNILCEAQVTRRIGYFFGTLANLDGFGSKTIERIVDRGFNTIFDIYNMSYNDFEDCGYKHKTIMNLGSELESSKERPIPDFRFLAALGIENLGIGSAKKLLEVFELEKILFGINADDIINIDGFGSKTSWEIYQSLYDNSEEISDIYSLKFNIVKEEIEVTESVFTGKNITFTGKMSQNRKGMEEQAKSLGANITGVNKKSDYLVIGANVGANKMNAAEKFGIEIITEEQYMEMI